MSREARQQAKIQALSREITILRREIANRKNLYDQVKSQLEKALTTVKDLRQQLRALRRENKDLQAQLKGQEDS